MVARGCRLTVMIHILYSIQKAAHRKRRTNMYRVNSKTILFITTFVWAACILLMGSVLINSGDKKQGVPNKQTVSKVMVIAEPKVISIIEKANNPFDMPVLNYERTAAQRVNIFPDEKAVYIRDGTGVGLMYCNILKKTDKPGIIAGRYYKGVGSG